MAMPNKLEEQRKQLVDKIVADMEAGKHLNVKKF